MYLIFRFTDKTKNDWEDRHNFQKVPGKYDLLIMDYNADKEEKDQVDAPVKEEKPTLESKLDKRIQNLVELICNVQAMEEMLKEMKYDTRKAPLGNYGIYIEDTFLSDIFRLSCLLMKIRMICPHAVSLHQTMRLRNQLGYHMKHDISFHSVSFQ